MSKDSDFLESLRIPAGDLIQCDGQELRKAKSFKRPWCKFDYERQLELARMARDPLIAVQAELYYLWYKLPKNDKSRPIELGSKVFKKMGFNPHDKFRALKHLENAGFIEIKWRKNQTPLVVVSHF
jgi:hypothetical protein